MRMTTESGLLVDVPGCEPRDDHDKWTCPRCWRLDWIDVGHDNCAILDPQGVRPYTYAVDALTLDCFPPIASVRVTCGCCREVVHGRIRVCDADDRARADRLPLMLAERHMLEHRHASFLLDDAEWDAMIAEMSAGPVRKPDEAEAECDRIAERIIAARKP